MTEQPSLAFISDNASGICLEAWQAMAAANQGHALAYGADRWSRRAEELLRTYLGSEEAELFFVAGGTAGNALALAHLGASYRSILCHASAHIAVDECGAPEFFSGSKLLPLSGEDGKLTPATVVAALEARDDVHHPRPAVLALTQPTEAGTVYTPAELTELTSLAHAHGLRVFLDGARFANAQAYLGVEAAAISHRAGIDAMVLGGAKNGLPPGEVVVFFDPELAKGFAGRRKQGGQLASKQRFLAAPWVGVLESGAWLRHAAHANRCARTLAAGLTSLEGVDLAFPVEANAVFLRCTSSLRSRIEQAGWLLLEDIQPGTLRALCSWSTTDEELQQLLDDLR